jgi:beta-glucosidase
MDRAGTTNGTGTEYWKQPFRWAAGIEGSIIPHLDIDQLEWTQHSRFWREDLTLAAKDLGCKWLRYSLAWDRIEIRPDVFEWTWVDERLELAEELGLNLIMDLVHFGVPNWLPGAFGDVEFPAALERFARAFGNRYANHPAIPTICPINEPLTTAYFSGDAGLWPPHAKGLASYMRILTNLAQGFCRATRALRETMPGIEIILCDSLEVAVTNEPESSERTSPHLAESLGIDVERRMQRRHVAFDLIMGMVTENHPLRDWLMSHGFLPSDLEWLNRNRQQIDLIGLDYYDHTEVEIFTSPEGHYRQRTNPNPIGLYRAAQAYWHRYHLPFMITETSAVGPIDRRLTWLDTCKNDVFRLRSEGFPCIGYTWWPLFDHLDWDGAMLHRTGHIHPVGIYALERQPDGALIRMPTELTHAYKALIREGDLAVGPINPKRINENKRAAKRRIVFHRSGENSESWPLIIYSDHKWNGPWQRQHHVAVELQRRHSVLFVERTWSSNHVPPGYTLESEAQYGRLRLLRISLPHEMGSDKARADSELQLLVRNALRTQIGNHTIEQAIHLVYDADLFSSCSPEFGAETIVYEFDTSKSRIGQSSISEGKLLETADAVITRNKRAFETTSAIRSTMISDGVDAKLFLHSQRSRTRIPHDVSFIGRPMIGLFGTIDDRVDIDLILGVVETGRCSVLAIGPVGGGVTPESLPRRANLFWIGSRPYHTLGCYAKAVDSWILPYKVDQPGLSPKKLPEYLITGRPVISTALPSLDPSLEASLKIAESKESFVELCLDSLKPAGRTDRRPIMLELARRPWRKVALEIENLIDRIRRQEIQNH